MKRTIGALLISIFLAGCGSQMVAYHPTDRISVPDASATLVDLQKKATFGSRAVVVAQDYVEYPDNHRFYFQAMDRVEIFQKGPAFLVYISSSENSAYVYCTDEMNNAKKYVDALESLSYAYNESHKQQSKQTDTDSTSVEARLRRLETLKKDGVITETEYQQKRKQILDGL